MIQRCALNLTPKVNFHIVTPIPPKPKFLFLATLTIYNWKRTYTGHFYCKSKQTVTVRSKLWGTTNINLGRPFGIRSDLCHTTLLSGLFDITVLSVNLEIVSGGKEIKLHNIDNKYIVLESTFQNLSWSLRTPFQCGHFENKWLNINWNYVNLHATGNCR